MEDLKRPLCNTMPELNMSSLGFRTDFGAGKKILVQISEEKNSEGQAKKRPLSPAIPYA
jgi:hypothetical protein